MNPPLPSKEHMNMHDLVLQAEFWKNREEVQLEIGALDNLVRYVENYRDKILAPIRKEVIQKMV